MTTKHPVDRDVVFASLNKNPKFVKWFRDTKCNKILYHGTLTNWFNLSPVFSKGDVGYHFGTFEVAQERIKTRMYNKGESYILPFVINIKNSLFIKHDYGNHFSPDNWNEFLKQDIIDSIELGYEPTKEFNLNSIPEFFNVKEVREYLMSIGYDSIIYKNKWETYCNENVTCSLCYICFLPNQIKSIFNEGTFDASNSNFMK